MEVDDWFPCHHVRGTPLFSRTLSGQLWLNIIEKAWAKVHAGFGNVHAGLSREALRDLTGAPCKTFFFFKEGETIWDLMVEARSKNFLMTAGSDVGVSVNDSKP